MMKERLHEIREKALAQINSTDSLEKLNEVRVSFLGKRRTYRSLKGHERRCTSGQTGSWTNRK